ncbi:MAG: ferredoxin [Deltaproteobacteria bacterium]|nr:MAG: ferredoxin [Deltaproteobacteria bacterium]
MIAHYGYKDASGEYFIILDTEKCDGCGACVDACRWGVLEVGVDPNNPFHEEPIVLVTEEHRNKLKYSCAQCKPVSDRPPLPCVSACPNGALSHSW